MTDSKTYPVPSDFDLERLGDELVTWFNETKHLDARGVPVPDGYLIQAQRRGGLRDWVGIDQALQVQLTLRSGRLEVRMGVAQGIDRFKERFPANILFTPLAVPAVVGAWLQKNLPQEVFDWIRHHTDHKVTQLFPVAKKSLSNGGQTNASQQTDRTHAADSLDAAERQLRPSGRYFQKNGKVEEQLLLRQLLPNEIVLAWLAVASVTNLPGDDLPQARKITWHYLLTTERSALLGYSNGGEPFVHELPAEPLHLSGSLARYTVAVHECSWKTQFSNDNLYEEIALVPAGDRRTRLREMSRLNWLHRGQDAASAKISRWLLAHLTTESSSPWDCLSSAYVQQAVDHEDSTDQALDSQAAKESLGSCLSRLLNLENSAEMLRQWAQRWGLSTLQQMSLVQIALDLQPVERSALVALPLHREVVTGISQKNKDATRRAIVDLSFARHLLQAGKQEEAVTVLEKRLLEMPDASLMDLLPPRDVDLTSGDTQIIRCRILELLAAARGEPDSPDTATVAELARLQPLVKSRVKQLTEASTGSLQNRARAIYKLLAPNGLDSGSYGEFALQVHPLPKNLLANRLPHPAARRGGAFEWLEGWLGKTQGPDYSALTSYVERVTAARYPEAMQALTDAAKAFGIKTIEAYISRGDKEVGVRVYEGSPPFLLIGGAHLDSQSEFHMMMPELRFVIACEIAHLHYHHTRLTSNELWTGVFRKGTKVLGIFGSLAGPLGYLGDAIQNIQNLKAGEIIFRKAEAVTGGAKKAVDFVGYAKDVQQVATGGKEKAEPEQRGLAEDNDKLLAAFRVMQLTADRSGLVLCGDIRAAVRAIFLSSRQYQADLSRFERHGLGEVLDQRSTAGDVVNQDLAIRLAALCSFYLSNDYIRLRHALTGD